MTFVFMFVTGRASAKAGRLQKRFEISLFFLSILWWAFNEFFHERHDHEAPDVGKMQLPPSV